MECPACHNPLLEGMTRCECGYEYRTCPHCRSVNRENGLNCNTCGEPLAQGGEEGAVFAPEPNQPQSHGVSGWILPVWALFRPTRLFEAMRDNEISTQSFIIATVIIFSLNGILSALTSFLSVLTESDPAKIAVSFFSGVINVVMTMVISLPLSVMMCAGITKLMVWLFKERVSFWALCQISCFAVLLDLINGLALIAVVVATFVVIAVQVGGSGSLPSPESPIALLGFLQPYFLTFTLAVAVPVVGSYVWKGVFYAKSLRIVGGMPNGKAAIIVTTLILLTVLLWAAFFGIIGFFFIAASQIKN